MNRLVQGVGVNDAGYQIQRTIKVDGIRKQVWACPLYESWKGMLKRCYSPSFHIKNPTYANCKVAPEWVQFSTFREWAVTQLWQGKQLDKDIILPGNKLYSADLCAFVTPALNNFLIDRGSKRGEWPLGVHWESRVNKFKAQYNNPFSGKKEYLGAFSCPHEAHLAWKRRKHELACEYADTVDDPRIAAALRIRFA